jgi:ATP adenylyltransferase
MLQAFPRGALAYFNCGPDSGASQPHKHTQVVPLPLAEGCSSASSAALPFQHVIEAAAREQGTAAGALVPLRQLPFQSYATLLPGR